MTMDNGRLDLACTYQLMEEPPSAVQTQWHQQALADMKEMDSISTRRRELTGRHNQNGDDPKGKGKKT